MRRFKPDENLLLATVLAEAKAIARKGRCGDSQHGVVIEKEGVILGKGYNGPEEGFFCDPAFCNSMCSWYSRGAEDRAVEDAMSRNVTLDGARVYSVKYKNGAQVAMTEAAYLDHAVMLAESGIKEFVLWRGPRKGNALYTLGDMSAAMQRESESKQNSNVRRYDGN